MGLVHQVCDVNQTIFLLLASHTGHLGYFYAVEDKKRVGVSLEGTMPTVDGQEVFLELLVLVNFSFD